MNNGYKVKVGDSGVWLPEEIATPELIECVKGKLEIKERLREIWKQSSMTDEEIQKDHPELDTKALCDRFRLMRMQEDIKGLLFFTDWA